MTTIILETIIHAPIENCFDLARDIDIHTKSTTETKEKAIAGRTSGLCELNDEITWEATHFGIRQQLTSKITELDFPKKFADKMLKGAFKSMYHEHFFEEKNGVTTMRDVFRYETPFGIFGKLFDKLILKNYMTKFLKTRNQVIKEIAEEKTNEIAISKSTNSKIVLYSEATKRDAYLKGLKLKDTGLDAETIYARLEKQGFHPELAKEVAINIMVQRREDALNSTELPNPFGVHQQFFTTKHNKKPKQ